MSIVMVNVGLDYHDDSVRTCILDEEGHELLNRDCLNNVAEVSSKIQDYGCPKVVAIEACCGAADFADKLRKMTDWDVRLAHPGYVARLKKSQDKTDRGDAFVLADLARVGYLPEVWLAPTSIRQLRAVSRHRQQLARERRVIKQQIVGLLREERVQRAPANRWTKRWRAWLETMPLRAETRWVLDEQFGRLAEVCARIARVEQHLKEMTANDPVVQYLLSLRGVGLVTAVTLRAEIGDFRRFQNGKQLARFCGVTPRNASSGKREADAGLVRACNHELRAILIEAAHSLVRHDPRWAKHKSHLTRTKPTPVAIAAVANRWLRWLYYRVVELADSMCEPEPDAA